MLKGLRFLAAAVLAAALGGCGGGGGDAPVARRVDGILDGSVTRNGLTYELHAIISHGRFMAYDSGGRFYDSVYEVEGDFTNNGVSLYDVNGAYGDSFDHVGFFSGTASFTAMESAGDGWEGAVGSDAYELTYDRDLDRQDSALSFIEGSWLFTNAQYTNTLTVAADGSTSTTSTYNGNPYNCPSAGSATVIESRFGIYDWQTTASGSACTTTQYTGFAFLSDGAEPLDTLTVLLGSSGQFLAFHFTRQ